MKYIPIRSLLFVRRFSLKLPRVFNPDERVLQTLIKDKRALEADFQIIKNSTIDRNGAIPKRRLRKAERNYPPRRLLFENNIEANTISLPSHIEPFILPMVKLEINYCSHNKDSDSLK